jgi:molybdopterin biosynthesis enzyme MoaB
MVEKRDMGLTNGTMGMNLEVIYKKKLKTDLVSKIMKMEINIEGFGKTVFQMATESISGPMAINTKAIGFKDKNMILVNLNGVTEESMKVNSFLIK